MRRSRLVRTVAFMPIQQLHETPATLDAGTVERLSVAFNRCFETLEAGEDVFAEDVFVDLYPPFWRFQLQGRAAFAAQLRAISEGVSSCSHPSCRADSERLRHGARGDAARSSVPRSPAGCGCARCGIDRITEVTGYCNGGWDDELRARHAAEAPMLRP